MRAAFFHDQVFRRDTSGHHYGNGSLPYEVLARYLKHFDRLVVVGRLRNSEEAARSLADGPGIEMACLETPNRWSLLLGRGLARRHVREVAAAVDCAIVRLPSAMGWIACEEMARAGKPLMVEVVGCAWDALWHHGSMAARILAPRGFLLTRRCVRRAPFALYVTREFLQRRYPCGGETVACSDAVVESPSREILDRRLTRAAEGFHDRHPTLGLVGSLDVDYKGHETALRALALAVKAGLDARLRLLGGGSSLRWRRLAQAFGIADRLTFDGTLAHGLAVLEWMDGLDAFLVPSLTEGLPRALVEAMSRGLPAIGAHSGGIPELIPPRWLHAPRDHQNLAALMLRLLGSPEMLKACAEENWRVAQAFAAEVLDRRRAAFLDRFRRFAEASRRSASPLPARAGA